MYIMALSSIILSLGTSITWAAPVKRPAGYEKWIGRPEAEVPHESLGGSSMEFGYTFREAKLEGQHVLILIKRNPAPMKNSFEKQEYLETGRILDVMIYPELRKNEHFFPVSLCEKKGSEDRVFGVVKSKEQYPKDARPVRAWRINRATQKFNGTAPKGILCGGDDVNP